jgi:hypothetical protein
MSSRACAKPVCRSDEHTRFEAMPWASPDMVSSDAEGRFSPGSSHGCPWLDHRPLSVAFGKATAALITVASSRPRAYRPFGAGGRMCG